ncbi:Tar ligand binding domain-containing protein, partial [Salmonella enterica]
MKAPELSVKNRLRAVLGLLGLMLIGGAVIGIGSMQEQNAGMGRIYDDEIVPAQLISQISQRSLMSFIFLGEASS